MKRNSSSSHMPLSKAVVGFLHYKEAEGLTDRTIASYTWQLKRWIEHEGDKEIGKIESKEIIANPNWLRNDYKPVIFSGKTHPLSPMQDSLESQAQKSGIINYSFKGIFSSFLPPEKG